MVDSPSPLASIERLPLSTYLSAGIGAALLALAAIALLGPEPGSANPSETDDVAQAKVAAEAEEASADASERPDPIAELGGEPAPDGDGDDDGGAADSATEDGAEPAAQESADVTGAADETAAADDGAGASDATGGGSGGTEGDDDEQVVVDDDATPDERGSSAAAPPIEPDPDAQAEAELTAEEMYEQGMQALADKRYRDAYRLGTRSYYKTKSRDTLALKAKAACGLNDEDSAKNSLRELPLGDDRRKEIRGYCRDRGVRLGL
ncbi:MAG: hypothetical protein AB1Z98_09320 [Nannocystaceae bacterium]